MSSCRATNANQHTGPRWAVGWSETMTVIKTEQFTAFVASKYPGQIVTLLEATRDICSDRWILVCRVGDCATPGMWYATSEEIVNAANPTESTRRETTTTTVNDMLNWTAGQSFTIGPGFGDSPEPEGAQRITVRLVPPRYGKTDAHRQFAAMQAMASVMGQVEKVAKMMAIEDSLYRTRSEDGPDPFGIKRAYLNAVAALLRDGWMDRAASRWSAQVRAKLAEREEARRDNYAIRVQGEED